VIDKTPANNNEHKPNTASPDGKHAISANLVQPKPTSEAPHHHETEPHKRLNPLKIFKQWLHNPKRERAKWTDAAIVFLTFGIVALATLQWLEMRGGGIQTEKIIAADQRLACANERFAKAMEDTVTNNKNALDKTTKENKMALAATLAQGQAALNASIQASHLDQRAWVGIAEFATVGGTHSNDPRLFSNRVQIAIRNSGKTPAINVSAITLQTSLDWRQNIGDYDAFVAEDNRQREEASAKRLKEIMQLHPEQAEALLANEKRMREAEARSIADLFPAGQVLAPGAAPIYETGSVNYVRDDIDRRGLVIYILGKITYSDIFSGTKKHTTKFCLMRRSGDNFTLCPSGNWMD
jgi:hypothetical protein